ncbi:20S-pre-rRNA D-site endonuclease nob1 [Conoideocrella luteorostrata]|uniref:20S-pre-rRNA D-site endonuclease NOB1 n=1 Tax=Conoideocrella luteorostrata TaxID=1105319 RepID=A0AAJ0CV15_9HYPO|nr:20S-pre-rRNA D-site endonuclease nob1 [Conoideocrella luteorostrata]
MATPPPADPVEGTASQAAGPANKPIHSLVLDTGPLIKNDPSVSALIAQAEKLYTIPAVIPEIRDPATRARVEATLLPFVTVRAPNPVSVKFVTEFARRTGDLAVLSRPDIEILALGYELECERNNGDWRLRNTPGQQRVNGRPKQAEDAVQQTEEAGASTNDVEDEQVLGESEPATHTVTGPESSESSTLEKKLNDLSLEISVDEASNATSVEEQIKVDQEFTPDTQVAEPTSANSTTTIDQMQEEDSDEDGWITPSNLKKHQAQDSRSSTPSQPMQKTLQAAILTSDYAMQNVALRINLNLVTPAFSRITHLKNWVLRCHGCFSITKDMEKQFCPKCGQPTLTRTSCSTDSSGKFQVHLKKNFQWNNRGNVYSVPKAVHGSANGRLPKGLGGKNGWGTGLILAEDQKEYVKAADEQRRQRKKDIMDDDYLPGILSGKRSGQGGKIRVGAGKNVNSKRKH